MDMDGSGNRSIVNRAKSILLTPKEEWSVIDRETRSSGEIFVGYAIPLAAIGPLCAIIGIQLFGYGMFGYHWRPSFMGSLSMAIGSFVLSLIGLFVLTIIASKLAPQFGGEASARKAFKLVVYAMTASWLAAAFSLLPALGFLRILGLYSFYLLYTGAGPLMKVQADKVMTYTIVTALCAFLLSLAVGWLSIGAVRMFNGGMMPPWGQPAMHRPQGGTLSLPGGVTIDTDKMARAAHDMETAIERGSTRGSEGKAVAPADLQALLPTSIGGYTRTATESTAVGPMGSHAEGTYESSGKSFKLSISDMAAIGAVAGMGAALGIEQNKEDADGYEHTTTKDGNLVVEKWDRTDKSGTFAKMVDKRFMIEAEGEADSIDQLKAAVASIDTGKLAGLAR